ncbi:Uncharacterised protein [Mycobacterium tuberculosis]|nr:Uncharacterised protein [Mycobacterium tuberculosis]CFS22746.1 Uncharacterised protein [Mycobacterium tuberculosis]CKN58623.1 Uncharacterised protein [Mycobacterium tuberculosis]CKP00481.1 Uncharacterised protein [Mycobacterium tuberculosis]CKS32887.1 Uncharacterised protein [Mycobacterium tuberculosis]
MWPLNSAATAADTSSAPAASTRVVAAAAAALAVLIAEPMLARSVAAAPSISGCANKNDMTVPLNPVGMSRLVVIVQHKRR